MHSLKLLHTVNSVGSTSFGFGQISVSLAKSQINLGHEVIIWCLDNRESIKWAATNQDLGENFFRGFEIVGPKNLWFSPSIIRQSARDAIGKFDIVHQHGIWTGISSASLQFSQKKHTPVIIAPHGTLDKWALNTSRFKKKIALAIYERSNLRFASCLHATSENEISQFRDFGLKNPIAYIQNGIHEKFIYSNGDPARFRETYSIASDRRILLFLSRISPKKGLLMLIEAINSLKNDFANWQLVIAGIDESNHLKEVMALIHKLGLVENVKVIGPLFGQDKSDAFAAAELFVLPSHSEGFPMVVLDSLAAGVPVITTKASSWDDLLIYNCGWWVDINSVALSNALRESIKLNTERLNEMGANGRKLIASKYAWPQLAEKTIQLYNWLLKKNSKPDFVVID